MQAVRPIVLRLRVRPLHWQPLRLGRCLSTVYAPTVTPAPPAPTIPSPAAAASSTVPRVVGLIREADVASAFGMVQTQMPRNATAGDWQALISALHDQPLGLGSLAAFHFLETMISHGVKPNNSTYRTLLLILRALSVKGYSGTVQYARVLKLDHPLVQKPPDFTVASLLDNLFAQGLRPSEPVYALAFDILHSIKAPGDVVKRLAAELEKDGHFSPRLAASLLRFARHPDQPISATAIQNKLNAASFDRSAAVWAEQTLTHAQAGQLQEMESAFAQCQTQGAFVSVSVFTAMIGAYIRAGQVDRGIEVLDRMKALNVPADVVVFTTLIQSLVRAGYPHQALKAVSLAKESDIQRDTPFYNTILEAQARGDDIDGLRSTLEDMKQLNVALGVKPLHSVIEALVANGRTSLAVAFFEESLTRGVKPRRDQWQMMLHELLRVRDLRRVQLYSDAMLAQGLPLDVSNYSMLIEAFVEREAPANAINAFWEMAKCTKVIPRATILALQQLLIAHRIRAPTLQIIRYLSSGEVSIEKPDSKPGISLYTKFLQFFETHDDWEAMQETLQLMMKQGLPVPSRYLTVLEPPPSIENPFEPLIDSLPSWIRKLVKKEPEAPPAAPQVPTPAASKPQLPPTPTEFIDVQVRDIGKPRKPS